VRDRGVGVAAAVGDQQYDPVAAGRGVRAVDGGVGHGSTVRSRDVADNAGSNEGDAAELVGVGPHPLPWPEDDRLDPELLAEGDRRNVVDRYRYWSVEAIVADLDVKTKLFAELGGICKPATIFASNTSSFPIAAMAKASGRPKQFVGLHFFNPVQLLMLVEVVRTHDTRDEVFAAARAFGEACGKTPVACKDTPGFVVNRLLVPYMADAMKMLERGDATTQDIDNAMKLGCGYPMGPFELTDYVGLDTTLSILQGWVKRFPDEPAFKIPSVLEKKVKEGKLGRKTGEGFYKWEGDKKA
jgi:3-hydroxyacyl-CoA dehydrogenase